MSRLIPALWCFVGLHAGCASWLSNQVPASVDGAIRAAGTAENEAALARLLDNPKMRDAIAASARALAEGTIEGAGSGPSEARIAALSAALAEGAAPALKDVLDLHLQDAATATLDHGFNRMLRELATARRNGTFEAVAGSVAAAMAAEITRSLRDVVGEEPARALGRAMATSFEQDMAPALARSFDGDGDLRRVLGETTQVVAEGALRGLAAQVRGELGDAMDERLRKHEEWLEEKTQMWWVFIARLAAGAAVVIGVLGWFAWRERRSAAARELHLVALLEALREEATRGDEHGVVDRVLANAAARPGVDPSTIASRAGRR